MRIFLGLILLIVLGETDCPGQSCSDFYYFKKDKAVAFIQYDSEGNILGKNIGIIKNVSVGNGMALSDYPILNYDADGYIRDELTTRVLCMKNNLKINFSIPDLPGTETYLSYPSDMKTGQKLDKDINRYFEIIVEDRKTGVFFSITDRKVIGQEIVKTSAGEFKSEKIQYNLNVKYDVAGTLIPSNKKIIEWFSPGNGIVKKEFYTMDGVLEGSSILAKFN